jgi:hypothetical protein
MIVIAEIVVTAYKLHEHSNKRSRASRGALRSSDSQLAVPQQTGMQFIERQKRVETNSKAE